MKIKTFRVLFLILVTAAALLGAGWKASAASVTLTVAADKTEAKPGDVIDLSITLGPVSEMGTMQMVIVIPDGLSYVQGSGALAPGLKEKLGYDIVDFTEISMMVNGVASAKDYSSEEKTIKEGSICEYTKLDSIFNRESLLDERINEDIDSLNKKNKIEIFKYKFLENKI